MWLARVAREHRGTHHAFRVRGFMGFSWETAGYGNGRVRTGCRRESTEMRAGIRWLRGSESTNVDGSRRSVVPRRGFESHAPRRLQGSVPKSAPASGGVHLEELVLDRASELRRVALQRRIERMTESAARIAARFIVGRRARRAPHQRQDHGGERHHDQSEQETAAPAWPATRFASRGTLALGCKRRAARSTTTARYGYSSSVAHTAICASRRSASARKRASSRSGTE